MTGANPDLVAELVELGLERREARWLVDKFVPSTPSDADALNDLRVAARRRINGEPLQYVIGHWPFRSLDLDVDVRVLIPRPETEELVDVALGELAISGAPAPVVVDLGCGSGAIGLALLDELRTRGVQATLVALDESVEALSVARINARKHDLLAVTFVESSWFENLNPSLRAHVDLIVANPPYVGASEMADLDAVLRHEPSGALVAPDESGVTGFADLAVIVRGAMTWLRPGGVLVVEHGDTHRPALLALTDECGYVNVRDHDDLAGRPRILVARRPQ